MSFLESAFETLVVISAIDNFTGPLRNMGASLGVLDAQVQATQATLKGFKNMAWVGAGLTVAGAAIGKGLLDAASAAGTLQMSLTGVKTALKLNNDEFRTAMNLSQTVGIPTGFKAQDVGNIMQSMATAGLSKQQVMDPAILKKYVNFADVQSALKKENGPDVAAMAVTMAHKYQLYDTSQLEPFLNQLNGALTHTHQSASEFQTSYTMMAPQARLMGMSADDSLTTTAWMDRMGMGGGRSGGGTAMADFLRRSIYGSSGKQADAAMQTAGFVVNGKSVFEDAKGAFVGMPAAIKIMQDFGTRFHEDATQMSPLLAKIFGVTGEKVAIGMASAGASDQYTNVQQQIQQSPTVNAAQLELSKNWARQMQQLGSSLNDVWTNFGQGVNASLLPFITSLNDVMANIVTWTQANPEVMKWIATFTEIATAVLLVVGPITLLTGVIGYLSEAKLVGAGFKLLGSAIGGAAGPIAILALGIYLLYEAWQNDFMGIRESSQGLFNWLGREIPKAGSLLKDLAKWLGILKDDGKLTMPAWLQAVITGVGTAYFSWKLLNGAIAIFNLLGDASPWVLAITGIIALVVLLATHWKEVTQAVNDAVAAVRNFFGVTSGGKTQEQQTENAHSQFTNGTLPAPNPNATLKPTPKPWYAFASGTDYAPGGTSLVGENGPEILNIPRGSQVIPNHKLGSMIPRKDGGGDTYHTEITINPTPNQSAKEIAQEVAKILGTGTRSNNMSRPMGPNRLVFG